MSGGNSHKSTLDNLRRMDFDQRGQVTLSHISQAIFSFTDRGKEFQLLIGGVIL